METSALTPKQVACSDIYYNIPIYQRLFAWTKDQIEPLLLDLLYNCIENNDSDYYIGLLTTNNKRDLVDGQQRFTVMTLMALVMREYCDKGLWNDFLQCNNTPRLSFSARKEDEGFLRTLINTEKCVDYVRSLYQNSDENKVYYNSAMVLGIISIADFIKNIGSVVIKDLELDESKIPTNECFVRYVYNHLAFFIQDLPDGYTARMLNKYFESMNSSGRNLENHEILKVDMLQSACSNDESKYSRLVMMWNKASMMDKTIFGLSDDNNVEYTKRIASKDFIYYDENNNKDDELSISTIIEKGNFEQYNVEEAHRETKFHSFLSFPDFLLQVLYIELQQCELKEEDRIIANRFFKRDDLGKTFKKYFPYISAAQFIEDLYKYRIILDWSVIRIDGEGDYNLLANDSECSKLEQYEALLFASSSQYTYYKWVPFILTTVADKGFSAEELLIALKRHDNKWHTKPDAGIFDYRNGIDSYYFRRLDYYLWEQIAYNESNSCDLLPKVHNISEDEVLKSIRMYKFHQYNSIEHLYPRNEDLQIEVAKWSLDPEYNHEEVKNQFGNLALISGSYNSTQSHQSLNHKFVNVRDHIADKKIESIKLVLMYCEADGNAINWGMKQSINHGNKMMEFLKSSYE